MTVFLQIQLFPSDVFPPLRILRRNLQAPAPLFLHLAWPMSPRVHLVVLACSNSNSLAKTLMPTLASTGETSNCLPGCANDFSYWKMDSIGTEAIAD